MHRLKKTGNDHELPDSVTPTMIYYNADQQTTVPLKSKLTVSTRSSNPDTSVSNVDKFKFRDARIEKQGVFK